MDRSSLQIGLAVNLLDGNVVRVRSLIADNRLAACLVAPVLPLGEMLPLRSAAAITKMAEEGVRTADDLLDWFERRPGRKPRIQERFSSVVRKEVGRALARFLVGEPRGKSAAPAEPDKESPVEKPARAALEVPKVAPVPIDDPVALGRWAEEHGVARAFDKPLLETLMRKLGRDAVYLLARMGRAATLRTAFLETRSDVTRPLDAAMLSDAASLQVKRAAAEFLLACAAEERAGREADARRRSARGATPAHPALQPLCAALYEARARARAVTLPASAEYVGPLDVSWRAAPPSIHVASSRQRLRLEDTLRVTIGLEDFPERSLRVECSCGRSDCASGVAAVDAVLDWAHRPEAALATQLIEFLAEPAWMRSLVLLDEGAAAIARAEKDHAAVRLTWRLSYRPPYFELHALLHKPLKAGGWSVGTRLRSSHDYHGPDAALVMRVFLLAQPAIYAETWRVYQALELLVGAGNVYLADEGTRPLTIRRGSVDLALSREPGGGLVVAPALDGDPTRSDAISGILDERLAIHLDLARHECVLVEVDPRVSRLVAKWGKRRLVFPPEAEAEVVKRLAALESHVPLALPAEMEGERVEADERLLLRLEPVPRGLTGAARVRPLAEAASFWPGEAPSRITGFRDGRRVHVERDLAVEVGRVRATLLAMPLATASWDGPFHFTLEGDEALDFVAALAGREDVVVEWPAGAETRAVVGRALPAQLRVAITDRHDWFGLEGGVEVAGEQVTLSRLLEAVLSGRRYVAVSGGRFLAISDELRARLAPAAHVIYAGRSGLEASPASAEVLEELAEAAGEASVCEAWTRWATRLRSARATTPELPETLCAELRPYQLEGFHWLARLSEWGVGGCLADDMGLGKTVQALAVILARSARGPTLVVAPTSVCFNWMRETERFAPSLRRHLYRETDRTASLARLGAGDVLVASYGLVVRHAEDLRKIRFATLVVDEAQAIKNAHTRRARAVRDLDAEWRVALTGTPVENHLGELWSLMRTVTPGLLGSWDQFRERFAVPIERDHDPLRRQALARVVRPFLLRRTKAEVAPELPARTEIRRTVALSPEERRCYDEARLAAVARLSAPGAANPEQKRFQVLAAIMRLRQLACHPRLLDPASPIASAKLAAFLDLVDELRDNGHRALVFSQFTSHLALVRESLDEKKVKYLYLDGQTPEAERAKRVDAFQRGEGDLFLISLKAGGMGLNLTAADYVLHLDPWWNPAVEDQATDRAHRIGQTRPVTVYRLIGQGTIEEAILALHERKRDLVAGILDGSDAAGRLSTEDLIDLIRESATPPGEVVDEEAPEEEPAGDAVTLPAALPSPPTPDPSSSPAKSARSLEALVEACKRRMAEESSGASQIRTARAYAAMLDRFVAHLRSVGAVVEDRASLTAAAEEYWKGLQAGDIAGPASAYLAARASLKRLGAFATTSDFGGAGAPRS